MVENCSSNISYKPWFEPKFNSEPWFDWFTKFQTVNISSQMRLMFRAKLSGDFRNCFALNGETLRNPAETSEISFARNTNLGLVDFQVMFESWAGLKI